MRRIIAITGLLTAITGLAGPALADQFVDGYYRSNGTYVNPYYRSSPNSSFDDNFSTSGNYNPYTGSPGYRRPSLDNSYPTYPRSYRNRY